MEERRCVQKRSGSIYVYMDFSLSILFGMAPIPASHGVFWGVEELTFAYYISFWHLIMV